MKRFIQLTILLSMIAAPFTSFASYLGDVYKSETEFLRRIDAGNIAFSHNMYSECLLIIDMVHNTKDSKKKKQLKPILEVRIRILMDNVLYNAEDSERRLAFHIKSRDEASTQEEVERQHGYILMVQQSIEEQRWAYGEVEDLLKHTR